LLRKSSTQSLKQRCTRLLYSRMLRCGVGLGIRGGGGRGGAPGAAAAAAQRVREAPPRPGRAHAAVAAGAAGQGGGRGGGVRSSAARRRRSGALRRRPAPVADLHVLQLRQERRPVLLRHSCHRLGREIHGCVPPRGRWEREGAVVRAAGQRGRRRRARSIGELETIVTRPAPPQEWTPTAIWTSPRPNRCRWRVGARGCGASGAPTARRRARRARHPLTRAARPRPADAAPPAAASGAPAPAAGAAPRPPVPVTLITGFLGAGKVGRGPALRAAAAGGAPRRPVPAIAAPSLAPQRASPPTPPPPPPARRRSCATS
jgi:hypothetical protein